MWKKPDALLFLIHLYLFIALLLIFVFMVYFQASKSSCKSIILFLRNWYLNVLLACWISCRTSENGHFWGSVFSVGIVAISSAVTENVSSVFSENLFQAICSFGMRTVELNCHIRLLLILNSSKLKVIWKAREKTCCEINVDKKQHSFQYYSFFPVEVQGVKTNPL